MRDTRVSTQPTPGSKTSRRPPLPRTRRLLTILLATLVACGDGGGDGGSEDADAPSPVLAFALMDPRDVAATYETYLARSGVDGIAIRTSWSDLEPGDGVYNWDALDVPLDIAGAHDKLATLHVIAASYASPPSWLLALDVQSYAETRPDGTSITQAVPWDPRYLSYWARFVDALARHLETTGRLPLVRFVSVAVPVPEMSLVDCVDGQLAHTIRYDRDAYLAAWQSTASAMERSLPSVDKLLSAPVSVICRPDGDGPRFYGEVLDAALALGPRFRIFAADLNALGSARLMGIAPQVTRAAVGVQFIWSYTNDPMNRFQGPLVDAVCRAIRDYGSTYFEVYPADLDSTDPATQEGLRAIHAPDLCPR